MQVIISLLKQILNALSGGGIIIQAGDIEIGGVEIKDGATDTRAKVKNDGTDNALVVTQNSTPLPSGAATSAKQDEQTAVLGATTDAIAATGAGGSLSAKLRRVTQGLADLLTGIILAAGENHIGAVGGHTARVAVTFNRPADTIPYASGDLVANSTVAGSVAPMSFAISRAAGKGGMIRRARLRKSGTSITNASFRLHLYSVSPVPANGDNGAWSTDGAMNYVGSFDVTVDKAFTDGSAGNAVPLVGSEINFTADTYYGLLEARGAYTPASAETFEVLLEVIQN
jgi:hypothetical protein